MRSRKVLGLVAIATFATLGSAQNDLDAERPEVDVSRARVEDELARWRAEHGDAWRMYYEPRTGHARFLYGGATDARLQPRSDADFVALAREALSATSSMHGIDGNHLLEDRVSFLPLGLVGSQDKFGVHFRQELSGIPVLHGFANVLFDPGGRLLAVDTTGVPIPEGFVTEPVVESEDARAQAARAFRADSGFAPTGTTAASLAIYQAERSGFLLPVLSWQVELWAEGPGFSARWAYWIDAGTGAIVARENRVHNFDVSGTVQSLATPGIAPDGPSNPPVPTVMAHMTVTSPQGNATTDSNGNFTIIGASAPLQVTVRYQGTFNDTNNSGGADYALTTTLDSASGNVVTMNPSPTQFVTSQSNSFHWGNTFRDWTRSVNPLDDTADFLAISNVNINQSCNATFSGNAVNFYRAAGGCVNTAFSTVIIHEIGHWMNVRYNSGNGSDGFGEGNADAFALYVTDQPILGMNFCGPGCGERSGLNTRQFCGNANPGCYGEVHNDGEVLMGALWKVRARLKGTLGNGVGAATANTLFNSWMTMFDDSEIKTIIELHWLTLDDDDGNINNGTPNYPDIDNGFRDQGFPGFTLPNVVFANVTELPDTLNTAGPYTVTADVTANFNPPVQGVNMHFRRNGGSFVTVPMVNVTGNTYSGSIPGQPCPSIVDYYLSGVDAQGQTSTHPVTAPIATLSFNVGLEIALFSDNFENNNGWTTQVLGASSGFWERGVPVNDPGWQYDPISDSDGSGQCFVTQNQNGNTDVDGGFVQLFSPVLDMSAGLNTIRYDYFLRLTNTGGQIDRLLVEISSNGSAGPWTTVALHATDGGLEWRTHEISQSELTAAGVSLTTNMMLRYSANDSNPQSIVESGLDAFQLTTVAGCSGCSASPLAYCTAKPGLACGVPQISSSGSPSASATSGFVVSAQPARSTRTGVLLYTNNGRANLPFPSGGHILCISASPLRRGGPTDSGGTPGPNCDGVFSLDMNAYASGNYNPPFPTHSPAAFLLVPGTQINCQWWGRDSVATGSFMSDALEYCVSP